MKLVALLAVVGATIAKTAALPYLPTFDGEIALSKLPTSKFPKPLTELKVTDNVVNLKRGNATSLSSMYLQALRRQAATTRPTGAAPTSGSTEFLSVEGGQVFLAPVTIGGQSFDVVVDTGSSDPWLVNSGYTCYNPNTDSSDCGFGTPYSASSTYSALSDENFNISYADLEHLTGTMGYDTFVMAGITVPNQEFAQVDDAVWSGDGVSSGLVGFAYSTLTSAYTGTNLSNDNMGDHVIYNTLFTNMYTNEGVPPVFSLAIDRDANNGGVLALGGIPDVPHGAYFASTPIIPYAINGTSGAPIYEFYTIVVDGFAVSASQSAQFNTYNTANSHKTPLLATQTSAIVDSGTSLFYAPNDVAAAVSAAFTPAGDYDDTAGAYNVSCTATPPLFGVSIDGKIFFVNPADMVYQISETECVSTIIPNNYGSSQPGLVILGDVWMKNVISVFDIGAEQMRFAAREFYGLSSQPVAAPGTSG